MADIRSISNSTSGASDEYIEQLRQKIGTEFTEKKASGKKRNELGKDDFMKLMAAQLKHQDPLSPLKNEEMAAQLAQFSALEQMVNMNTNLEKMTAAQRPQENVLAASLIGKMVSTESSRFQYQKGAQPEVKFDLPAAAANVNVTMVDAKGEVIREYELGSMAQGPQSLRWDGKNSKNLEAQAGEYTYRVNATDSNGKQIPIETSSGGVVNGVTFEGGKALLLVGDKKIPMEAVTQIESAGPKAPASVGPGAGMLPGAGIGAMDARIANSLTGGSKQNTSSAEKSVEEKTTQGARNPLPTELDAEKMKMMLGALGASSRMGEESGDLPSGAEEGVPPQPLWNPGNL